MVEPDLSIAGHPEIAVIGDLAAATSHGQGEPTPVPGISPAAKQMGRTAAANLAAPAERRADPAVPLHRLRQPGDRRPQGGDRRPAVPGLGALRFSGFPAWLFWLFAHIYFLIGFRNRLIVMVDWAWAYFTYERSARVVAEPDADAASAPLLESSHGHTHLPGPPEHRAHPRGAASRTAAPPC